MKGKFAESPCFGRVGHVEIYMGNGRTIDLSGLDFKFSIEQSPCSAVAGGCDVHVLNLNDQTRKIMTAVKDQMSNVMRGMKIRVYAGYETSDTYGGGEICICDCDIDKAIPTSSPPDVWMNFHGIYGNSLQYIMAEFCDTTPGLYFKLLCQRCVDRVINMADKTTHTELVFRADNKIAYKTLIDGSGHGCVKYEPNSISQIPNWLSQKADAYCYFDLSDTPIKNGKPVRNLYVTNKPTGAVNYGVRMSGITYTKIVDEKHGMIGLPSFTPPNCVSCTMLLDPRLRVSDAIRLHSNLISGIDGTYYISKLTHTGHFRGHEWYTKVEAYDPTRVPKTIQR